MDLFPAPVSLSKPQLIVTWIAQIAAAAILAQTLFFKFTGAEEAKWIFTKLGVEPWGRIGLGVAELITALLLLTPRTAPIGALMAVGMMVGAIGSHLAVLGIKVKGDASLFILAIVTLVASLVVLAIRRGQIPLIGARLVTGGS